MRKRSIPIVVAVCAAGVLTFCRVPDAESAKRALMVVNRSNARQMAEACRIYAFDHDGHFPTHLSELEPDYLPDSAHWRYIADAKAAPPVVEDWAYFGAGFTEENPPRILIAAPNFYVSQNQFFWFGRGKMRVYVEGNRTAHVGAEADYQQLLAETIRQTEAVRESGNTPSSPATPP
jgi:hypothetical protein